MGLANGNLAFFSGSICVGAISGMAPEATELGRKIARSKTRTKLLLAESGVPFARGRSFRPADLVEALEYFDAGAFPRAVLKPEDGSQGKGVATGLQTPEHVENAWHRITAEHPGSDIILEEEIPGVDVRVFVVAGRARAAIVRIPPFVVGDGRSSLNELVRRLRGARAEHTYLHARTLSVDASYLAHSGIDEATILPDGTVQFLNNTANVSRGGVYVDVTREIQKSVLRIAERAALAIPGHLAIGVDILAPDLRSANGAKVAEVNSHMNPLVHELPVFGRPRNVTRDVIDAMIRRRLSEMTWRQRITLGIHRVRRSTAP